MSDQPSPPVECCDVCQDRPALVTLGCVDYCASCAPIWHPSFEPADPPTLEVVR